MKNNAIALSSRNKRTLSRIALSIALTVIGTSAYALQTTTTQSNQVSTPTETTTAAVVAPFKVEVSGQGRAIILIPGLASSSSVWKETVAALQDRYQVHVLTLAGFAGTKALPNSAMSQGFIAAQEQALVDYIAKQQLHKPIVIGHSLGGFLALSMAAHHSDKISAAINVDGLPALGAMYAEAQANMQKSGTTPTQQSTSFDPMALAKNMTNNTAWHTQIANDMMRSDPMTSGRTMSELSSKDLRPALTKVRVPVLTLGALQNGAPYTPAEQVQATYEKQLANIPKDLNHMAFAKDSKHFIMADAPAWMQLQIKDFLTKTNLNP
jgi:pimeloyl-ACP methyl ester carboxylesterase